MALEGRQVVVGWRHGLHAGSDDSDGGARKEQVVYIVLVVTVVRAGHRVVRDRQTDRHGIGGRGFLQTRCVTGIATVMVGTKAIG